MNVGILALQGAFNLHKKVLDRLDIKSILVRDKRDMSNIDALILPGGESTVMLRLLSEHDLNISEKINQIPIFATCAGVVLLAKLNLLDISIKRNGYGSQLKSDIHNLKIELAGRYIEMDGYFIRAPIITEIRDVNIDILSFHDKDPVLIQKNNILASTFHPELSGSDILHSYFLENLHKKV